MRKAVLDKTGIVTCILALALSGLLVIGCASTSERHETIIRQGPFSMLYAELNMVAKAEPVNGQELVVRFPAVALFGVDEYSLQPGARQNLEGVAQVLKRYPEFIVIVEGHTDSRGEESYNQWLSERRSRIVADVFVGAGLDPTRIQVVGYGESRPLTTNRTSEGRQQNRRVELHIKPMQP
ncbi:MAG: OmpA family protein [Candidatus Abyssobacteria bacterium SURF_17]|uniref:OmpA family protein n=1 Tax=Candidatus Abyssobacteria bacterium SURF_17 TaxID=2093361 RepID=A0A419F514_9BACT|nr:MAG: OmpA family protein [Candidatus Abyssubacteria bacterium SURF_17]